MSKVGLRKVTLIVSSGLKIQTQTVWSKALLLLTMLYHFFQYLVPFQKYPKDFLYSTLFTSIVNTPDHILKFVPSPNLLFLLINKSQHLNGI